MYSNSAVCMAGTCHRILPLPAARQILRSLGVVWAAWACPDRDSLHTSSVLPNTRQHSRRPMPHGRRQGARALQRRPDLRMRMPGERSHLRSERSALDSAPRHARVHMRCHERSCATRVGCTTTCDSSPLARAAIVLVVATERRGGAGARDASGGRMPRRRTRHQPSTFGFATLTGAFHALAAASHCALVDW